MPDDVKDATQAREREKPHSFNTKIGQTTYTVFVHFSQTSKETLQDKLLRLILREAESTDTANKD